MGQFVYAYDANTKEYKGKVEAQESPLEPGQYLDDIPNTLKVEPPATGSNETSVAEEGAWVVRPDYRGTWYRPDRTPIEIAQIGVEPDPSWTNSPPPLTLGEVKDAVWQEIKSHRDDLQVSGVTVDGHWFHNDVKSRTQWERMANKANILLSEGGIEADPYVIDGEQVQWKTMTGSYVPLTLGLVLEVTGALEVQEARIFKTAAIKEATMRALPDVAAVAAYDWKADWPEVFVDESQAGVL